ncbi:MAG: hypothetical protein ACYDAQ_05490 [Mycobacteriales bacterium]
MTFTSGEAWLVRLATDFDSLSMRQQRAFLVAVGAFVSDFRSGGAFRKGLRVKGVTGSPAIFERP